MGLSFAAFRASKSSLSFLQVSCKFPAGFLQVSCGFPAGFLQVSCGFSADFCAFPSQKWFSQFAAGFLAFPRSFVAACIILSTCLHRAHTSPRNLLASLTRLSPSPFFKPLNLWRNTTSRGFEPLQAKPNEFQVYLLSRSGCRAATILALARMLQGLRSLVRDTVSERLRRWTRNPLGSARRGSNPLVACCARARGLRRKPMQVRPPGIEPGTI